MYLTKSVIIFVNKKFGNGNVINEPSLDFAVKYDSKGIFGNLPFIVRALLVDHCFEDGNKRTATFLIINYCEENRIKVNQERILKAVRKVASTNPKDIEKMRSVLKYAIRSS